VCGSAQIGHIAEGPRDSVAGMREILIGLAVALGGCSFGMTSVRSDWDGTSEPECTADIGPPLGDGLMGGILAGVAIAAADAQNDLVGLPALAGAIIFAVASYTGEETYKDCKSAKAQWRIGGAIGRASRPRDEERHNRNGAMVPDETDEERPLRKPAPASVVTVAPPRGFFCAVSPSVASAGLCTREKESCETVRGSAVAVVPDLAACALVETAWCFADKRCAPTEDACTVQREKLVGPDGIAKECAETK